MFGGLLTLIAIGWLLRLGVRRWRGTGTEGLPALLASAETAGIITAAQREQLLAHAATLAPGPRFGAVAWLGVFAGLFVVAGVSLLIASNWEAIGPTMRVGVFVVAFALVGEAAIRTRDRALALALPLELLWFFSPLLGIGLYGQTFQLSGDPIRPFLVWLVLTAPIAWLSARPFVAAIHTAAMVMVLFTGNFVVDPAAEFFGGGPSSGGGMLALTGDAVTPFAWITTALLLAAIATQSLRLLPRAHRHHFVGIFAFWLFALLVAPTPFRIQHPGWMIVAAVALSTGWVVVLAALETSMEERGAAMLVWLGTIYGLTFTWHLDTTASGDTSRAGIVIVGLAIAAACGGALVLPASRLSPHASWARAAKAILVAPTVLALAYLGSDLQLIWTAAALMNVLLVAIAVGLMWHGSLVHEIPQINLGVLVLVWVLVTRFLDLFGSMLQSGVGFIVAGLLLAGLSWALERTRRRLIGAREATS